MPSRFKKKNQCPHTGKKLSTYFKATNYSSAMHRKTSRQALGQCKNTTSWGRMIGRDGQNFHPRSQAQNAAQPCLYDVYDPLTGNTKKAGLKTTFSPEIAVLSTERLKNSRISQMNSPVQLLEMCSSWHG